jgi:hypothetical protein
MSFVVRCLYDSLLCTNLTHLFVVLFLFFSSRQQGGQPAPRQLAFDGDDDARVASLSPAASLAAAPAAAPTTLAITDGTPVGTAPPLEQSTSAAAASPPFQFGSGAPAAASGGFQFGSGTPAAASGEIG